MCSFYSCMTFLWEDSGTSTHWPRVGKAWHQLVHIFFPMPANRLHFCNRKTSHGDQEATTWPAQTFTLWTPAQTLRHSLLSWGKSPSPTHSSIHSKPSWWWRLSQQLAGQGTFHTGVTYNVISWQKAADQVCLSWILKHTVFKWILLFIKRSGEVYSFFYKHFFLHSCG